MTTEPDGPWLSRAAIAKQLQQNRSTVSRRLEAMLDQGCSIATKTDARGHELICFGDYERENARTIDAVRSLAVSQRPDVARKPAPPVPVVDEGDGDGGDDPSGDVVVLDELQTSFATFLDTVEAAFEILPLRFQEITKALSPSHADEAVRSIQNQMRQTVKAAADNVRFRTYRLTPKGKAALS